MRKTMGGAVAALLALSGMTARAGDCASSADLAALRTAALQQELMVAAFSCGDIERYNRFVRAHQPELIASDARLKAYFVHRDHRDAGYHTYKTELANAASLRSIRDEDFCAGAQDGFEAASGQNGLASATDSLDWNGAAYPACPGALPLVQTAAVQPRHARDDSDEDRFATRHHTPSSDRDSGGGPAELSAPAPHRPLEESAGMN